MASFGAAEQLVKPGQGFPLGGLVYVGVDLVRGRDVRVAKDGLSIAGRDQLARELCQSLTGSAGTAPTPAGTAPTPAGGMPSPDGREPSGLGAATRSAGPHPQAGSSRSNARHGDRDREN
jgi:hypothetical protein